LLDRNLRMAQVLRASLAYDRTLPWNLFATAEVIFSRHLSDFMFVNLNLEGPQSIDSIGRVLYGGIGTNGVATPEPRSHFAEVIDLRNTSKNYAYQLSVRVEKEFKDGIAATASYTYSRVRDVQSPSRVNFPGITLWGDARAVSGRHDIVSPGVALNDLPHRLVAGFTFTAPWRHAPTTVSLYYVGESGSPFTYLAYGSNKRGDLNADGSNVNDPIYVPSDVFDPGEILFDGSSSDPDADNSTAARAERVHAQRTAFASFIDQSSCLSQHRGQVLERNRCREPRSQKTILSVRQGIPIFGKRHGLEAGIDVYNVLNLLNHRWGRYRLANPRLLQHVGQTGGTAGATQPIFRFEPRPEWTTDPTESVYQLQLTLRYSF
jgi:hypothetical protein